MGQALQCLAVGGLRPRPLAGGLLALAIVWQGAAYVRFQACAATSDPSGAAGETVLTWLQLAPPSTRLGGYWLETGFYDTASDRRLALYQG